MNQTIISSLLPGAVLCLVLAAVAAAAGSAVPIVGGAVFALVFGVAAGPFLRRDAFVPGIRFTGKKLLQYSIVLLGFGMQLPVVLRVGGQSLLVMACSLAAAFSVAAVLGRALGVTRNEAVLIGVGTSICGGSAIAATAPVIGASDEEVAQSISTIFLFNIAAVFIFPALGQLLGLGDRGFGVWAGTAINDTSSVVAAASAWSQSSGTDEALSLATVVKLTRTLMIVPITLVLSAAESRRKSAVGGREAFSLTRIFPWFVLGFVAASAIASFLPVPAGLSRGLGGAGKFLIVAAMAAIGLSTDLRRLLSNGRRPILLGLGCWAAVAVSSLLAQSLTGLRSTTP